MGRRRARKRGSLDDAMRWSLDMGRGARHRRDLKPPVKQSRPPPAAAEEREPTTLPPDPPPARDHPEPQPETVDESAVQITRR